MKNIYYLSLSIVMAFIPFSYSKANIPSNWKLGEYYYKSHNQSLEDMLSNAARSYNVRTSFDDIPNKIIQKNFKVNNFIGLLERVEIEFDLDWFFYNDTIYFSNKSDRVKQDISVTKSSLFELSNHLDSLGLKNKKFGWEYISDSETLRLSGPEQYVNLIIGFIGSGQALAQHDEYVPMVFELKYASVSDRKMSFRQQNSFIPGVATLLRKITGDAAPLLSSELPVNPSLNTNSHVETGEISEFLNGSVDELDDTIAIQDKVIKRFFNPNSSNKPASSKRVRVAEDVARNSIIIYDSIKRRSYYQSLINRLDRPQKMFEINAMILEVNESVSQKFGADLAIFTEGKQFFSGENTTSRNISISNGKNFFAKIKAYQDKGLIKLTANTSVLTIENSPAIIDFSKTLYLPVHGERVASFLPVVSGTSLRVTPRELGFASPRTIQLSVDLEDGDVNFENNGSSASKKVAEIKTQATLLENQPLVLGGVNSTRIDSSTSKVPVLGDVPLAGLLFKQKTNQKSFSYRYYIITPKIIGDQSTADKFRIAEGNYSTSYVTNKANLIKAQSEKRAKIESVMTEVMYSRNITSLKILGGIKSSSNQCILPPGVSLLNSTRTFSDGEIKLTVYSLTNVGKRRVYLERIHCPFSNVLAISAWPLNQLSKGMNSNLFVFSNN
ncbi:secretin N-terminal domain-containing protein [Candidatus Pantoea multigeneris]|nr:secretin N-terminal domain-containing protein [Pantoea multigeneris]